MDSQDYLEIKVNVPGEELGDIIAAAVSELGYDAFMFEDGVQKCYIQGAMYDEMALTLTLRSIEEFTGAQLDWSMEAMPKVNWNAEWERTGFTPIECGDYVVMPFGCDYEGSLEPIFLNPQMAFGTGHHHTTFMMMQTMQSIDLQGASVMDLGCGTAVLAILAAKLGAARVSGIDIDAVAARSAQENVSLNSLDFPIVCGDASDLEQNAYDVLLANIHRNIIINDLPLYATAIRKGGRLLISGFYEEDVDDILSAASQHGFALSESETPAIRSREGWCCVSLKKRI